ncbi:MAG TPA: A/G-specific adenine glycosylase [Terriglobales bacterium]
MSRQANLKPSNLPKFRRELLGWYDHHGRDLPWRKSRDPYRVWVSEIMLQQTRVAAVLLRYEQFLRRFPSIQKLAAARQASVLAEWSGLGYYRRARNLHAAAKVIARERSGKFPQNVEAWRDLPGIGRYTAAAIASIAFNEPAAVLDGNVERVSRRLLGRVHSPKESWAVAQQLLDCARPGDFNQAMMELGATVCLPGQPRCPECPIAHFCRTRGHGASVSRKPRQTKREINCVLAQNQNKDSIVLVRRAPNESLMPDMWELPLLASHKISDEKLFSVRHSITITDFKVNVIRRHGFPRGTGEWVRISRLNVLPLTGLAKKILRRAKIIQ